MSTDQGTPRPRRSQPLDWAVVEPLAGCARDIAKGWLLLLLERTPLHGVGAFPVAALAAEGPALCTAFVRALGSEGDLERLRPDGALAADVRRIGALTGAADAGATVAVVDALRACVWSAALDGGRLDARDPAAVGALAERLATVSAVLAETAVGAAEPAAAAPAAGMPPSGAPSPAAAPAAELAPSGAPSPAAAPAAAGTPPPAVPPAPATTPVEPAGASAPRDAAAAPPFAGDDLQDGDEPVPAVQDLRGGGSVTELPTRPAADPAAAADMDDADLWIATLERHIDRCQREGGGLALLRVELVDGERLAASAPEGQAGVPYGRLAQAIRRAIRRQDLVASDHQGRAWVIAPAVGRAGAIALAERIGAGVEDGETWRGGPLAATIGFAVFGEDGRDAATLIERADEAMLSAAAAGVRIGEAIPAPDDGPAGPAGPRLVR